MQPEACEQREGGRFSFLSWECAGLLIPPQFCMDTCSRDRNHFLFLESQQQGPSQSSKSEANIHLEPNTQVSKFFMHLYLLMENYDLQIHRMLDLKYSITPRKGKLPRHMHCQHALSVTQFPSRETKTENASVSPFPPNHLILYFSNTNPMISGRWWE